MDVAVTGYGNVAWAIDNAELGNGGGALKMNDTVYL